MFRFGRSLANSSTSESPGNTPGAALKKRSLRSDLSPGSWRHHRRDAFDPYELLAKYELTQDGVEAGGKRRPKVQRWRGWVVLLLAALVWLIVGTILYAFVNGWNFAQSIYFAVDVGFLVGSGAAPESRDSSMLISAAMVVSGACFLVKALQQYVRGKFADLDELDRKARRRALDIVGVVSRRQGLDDSSDIDGKGAQGFQPGSGSAAAVLLVLWLALGLGWACMVPGWGFCRALRFALGALTTAGLEAAPMTGADDRADSRTAVFVAFYQAVGACFFGFAILCVVDALVHREAYERAKLANAFLKKSSVDRVRALLGDAERVTFGEFVVLEFVRQGRLDCDALEVLRHAFDDVVGDGNDTIDRQEVARFHKVSACRQRYATHLRRSKKLPPDYALEAALELDVEYLVLKAVRNGWLADPAPEASRAPSPDAAPDDMALLREIAKAHAVDIEDPAEQRRSSSRSSSLTPQEAQRSSSRHLDKLREHMQKTPRTEKKAHFASEAVARRPSDPRPPPPPESPEKPRVQGRMDASDSSDDSYAEDAGDMGVEEM